MAELLAIKRELTVIKVQIDGLLDCVDKMDRQRKDCSGRIICLTRLLSLMKATKILVNQ